jgi:hypothetical protein
LEYDYGKLVNNIVGYKKSQRLQEWFMSEKDLSLEKGLIRYEDISQSQVEEFSLDVSHSLILTKLLYAIDGRNAWWATWVRRFYPRTFSLDIDFAKDRVEINRVQGSTWTLWEVPALAFIGSHGALIVTQINAENILKYYEINPLVLPYIGQIADHFKPKNKNDEIRRFLTADIHKISETRKYRRFESAPVGGGYRLSWHGYDQDDIKFPSLTGWIKDYPDILKKKCYFGLYFSPTRNIATITRIGPGSPVDKLGLCVNDVVTKMIDHSDGYTTDNLQEFFSKVMPNSAVTFEIKRQEKLIAYNFVTISFYDVLKTNKTVT